MRGFTFFLVLVSFSSVHLWLCAMAQEQKTLKKSSQKYSSGESITTKDTTVNTEQTSSTIVSVDVDNGNDSESDNEDDDASVGEIIADGIETAGNIASIRSCFPATSYVTLKSGAKVKMEDLKNGDSVQVGPNSFSEVFGFTHRDHTVFGEFLSIEFSKNKSIELTGSHYIYINRESIAVPAKVVKVGDLLVSANGTLVMVKDVKKILKRGLFNPQTYHGDIVVDNIVTTTFTEALNPRAAHCALSPLRLLYKLVGFSVSVNHY